MHRSLSALVAVAALGGAAGCTAGNGALEPAFTSVDLTKDKLQVAVGVATFADGSKGLNAVATFRQPNGLSATLLNTPTLTVPFTVPTVSGSTNTDAGTNHISGSPQALPGTTPVATTFGQSGGVFAYGFAPENSTTSGAVSFSLYSSPFFGSSALTGNPSDANMNTLAYRGGPPLYPYTQNNTFPTGFLGYTLGFTTFVAAPTAGNYGLSVNVPSANNPGATITAPNAALANTTGLGAFAAGPTFTQDGAGGGTATCAAPAGTTETLVELIDTTTILYYSVLVQGGGAIAATFPANLGPAAPGTTTPTRSVAAGDTYAVECIAADYQLYEAGPPANRQETPTLLGSAGQADISFSPSFTSAGY